MKLTKPGILAAGAALLLTPLTIAGAIIPSTPDLGKAEARCRAGETGPAFMVRIDGLKDHTGNIKLEVYPANDGDFLQDDNILISQGKAFRRVEVPVSAGDNILCVRLPAPGNYAVSVLHDRDRNRKFGLSIDGIGFSGNPRLGFSKPKAAAVRVAAGGGMTPVTVVMNYRKGLMSFGPLSKR